MCQLREREKNNLTFLFCTNEINKFVFSKLLCPFLKFVKVEKLGVLGPRMI